MTGRARWSSPVERTGLYLVCEIKGTRDFLNLRTEKTDKGCCGQKHFEAIGVPFAVVINAGEV